MYAGTQPPRLTVFLLRMDIQINDNLLDPNHLIYAYCSGAFPMADPDTDLIHWFSPDPRAIIPLEGYKPAKSLRPLLNKRVFEIKIDADFEGVMRGCALPRHDTDDTWINEDLIKAFVKLNTMGVAHSIEAYHDGKLVGGLYGVAIGGAYFGESMFHTVPNASKVAFHYLMKILAYHGFALLDTQFINDNVRRFGAVEIPRDSYMLLLRYALSKYCEFYLPKDLKVL